MAAGPGSPCPVRERGATPEGKLSWALAKAAAPLAEIGPSGANRRLANSWQGSGAETFTPQRHHAGNRLIFPAAATKLKYGRRLALEEFGVREPEHFGAWGELSTLASSAAWDLCSRSESAMPTPEH